MKYTNTRQKDGGHWGWSKFYSGLITANNDGYGTDLTANTKDEEVRQR